MPQQRNICSYCLRPEKTCICDIVKEIPNRTQLIIWQHPSEQNHPKGSAQLLRMCFKNSIIFTAEKFSPIELGIQTDRCALLYPSTDTTNNKTEKSNSIQQLILIDGTWRKSRKIIYLNPWLNNLPRISIPEGIGRYRIRKAETENQLSSFEAGAIAIGQLDNAAYYQDTLHSVFEQFIQRWEAFLPETSVKKG